MKKVTIRQCPVLAGTREYAAGLAAALKREPGVEVDVVEGDMGETTVMVDGRTVARKWLLFKPSLEQVLIAVREAPTAVEV
jgi:hypothetical protein